jgi:hypothetical protein
MNVTEVAGGISTYIKQVWRILRFFKDFREVKPITVAARSKTRTVFSVLLYVYVVLCW